MICKENRPQRPRPIRECDSRYITVARTCGLFTVYKMRMLRANDRPNLRVEFITTYFEIKKEDKNVPAGAVEEKWNFHFALFIFVNRG